MSSNKSSQALKTAAVIAGTLAASGAAGIALAYAVEQWQELQAFEQPLSRDDLKTLSDGEGTVKNVSQLSARVSRGGVSPELRRKVWPILLGVPYAAAASAADRQVAAEATKQHYDALQRRTEELLRSAEAERSAAAPGAGGEGGEGGSGEAGPPPPAPPPPSPRSAAFSEAVRIIAVDVPRTPLPPRLSGAARPEAEAIITRMLQAFAVEEPDIGYCQGMSEVAAVFLHEFSSSSGGGVDFLEPFAAALAGASGGAAGGDSAASSSSAAAGGGPASRPRGGGALTVDEAECYASLAHFLFRFRRNFLVNNEGILGQLRALGDYVKAADPQVHEAIVAAGGGDFVFGLRPFALLLMRELGTSRVADYWDHLIAASDGPRFHIAVVAAALLQKRWAIIHAGSLDRLLLIVNQMVVGRTDAPRLQRLLLDARKLLLSRVRPQ